jgi:hypothetical protein
LRLQVRAVLRIDLDLAVKLRRVHGARQADSSGHGTLLGANTAKAWDEVHKQGRKLKNNKRKKPVAA